MDQMAYYIPEELNPIFNPDLTLQLGRMYYELGREEELRTRLDRVSVYPNATVENLGRYAAIYHQLFRDSVNVHEMVDRILDSGDPQGIYQAATTIYSVRAYAAAVRLFEQSLKWKPEDGQAIGALSQCYEKLHRYDDAIRMIDGWVKLHPTDTGAKARLEHFRKLQTSASSDSEAQG